VAPARAAELARRQRARRSFAGHPAGALRVRGDNWHVYSAYPDAPGGAYANVAIRSQRSGECLTVLNQVAQPAGFGNEVSPRPCNNSAAQEWASTRSADGYINYFNFQYRVCLDGGYGDTYGFPENGCNAHGENHYQDWYYLPAAV
ncbi:hypothetical protein ABZ646_45915, partial [Streptomyces sp. NPDC007162]